MFESDSVFMCKVVYSWWLPVQLPNANAP